MSIKKTWFSYILWLLATGFSVCFFCINTGKLVSVIGLYGTTTFVFRTLYSVIFLLVVIAVCVGLCLLRQKITMPDIPKWAERIMHIIIILVISIIFVITRINAVFNVVYDSQTVINLYEISKIGANIDAVSEPITVLDQMYSGLLSVVFLFLGNKIEAMLYVQLFLQICIFLLLFYIGNKRLGGYAIWVPAAGYAVSPLFADATTDMGAANFWFFLVVCLIAFLCILERFLPPKEHIADVIVNICGLIAGTVIFFTKIGSFSSGSYFMMQETTTIIGTAYFIGAIVLACLLILYCVSFWFSKREFASVYIVVAYLYAGLFYLLQPGELDVERLLLMLMHFQLYFVVAHGLFIFFTERAVLRTVVEDDGPIWGEMSRSEISKRDVAIMEEINSGIKESNQNNIEKETPNTTVDAKALTAPEVIIKETQPEKKDKKSKPSNFEWWEKDKKMDNKHTITETVTVATAPTFIVEPEKEHEEEKPVLIRVSDIVKNTSSENEDAFSLSNKSDKAQDVTVIDKTAMIENVLPMPKKHVNRTLDYAFEPSAEQMCYDIEVSADDDYDYQD